MDFPVISVIVPIYNVERYVRKCLDSLVHQTMREIEVICIDDGSTDGSGGIAEEYAGIHDGGLLVRVIHTENRGLSAARNRGIDESWADWLMFVDSDDWVSKDFCRIPYEIALEIHADLVIFGENTVRRGIIHKKLNKDVGCTDRIVDFLTAVEYGSTVAWNKLYKRQLFDAIKYPEGRTYEDIATTHKLLIRAKKIYFLKEQLYYHVLRKKSISHTYSISGKKDRFIAILERYDFLKEYGYPIDKMEKSIYKFAFSFLMSTYPSKDEIYSRAQDFMDEIEGIPKMFSIKQRIAFVIWKQNRKLFYRLCRIRNLNSID